jgi:outer membrane lipoprotein-sorting protein
MVPFFAGDPRELTRSYRVTLERPTAAAPPESSGKEERTLVLEPRETTSPVKRLEISFAGFDVRGYRQVDASGDEAVMTVLSSELNARVPAERFQLEVPAGTVVVRLDGK